MRYDRRVARRNMVAMLATFLVFVTSPAWVAGCFSGDELDEIHGSPAEEPTDPFAEDHEVFLREIGPAVLQAASGDLLNDLAYGEGEVLRRLQYAASDPAVREHEAVLALQENDQFVAITEAVQMHGWLGLAGVISAVGMDQISPHLRPAFGAIVTSASNAPAVRLASDDPLFAQDMRAAPIVETALPPVVVAILVIVALVVILWVLDSYFRPYLPAEIGGPLHQAVLQLKRWWAEAGQVWTAILDLPRRFDKFIDDCSRGADDLIFVDPKFCECTFNRPFTDVNCPEIRIDIPDGSIEAACEVFGC